MSYIKMKIEYKDHDKVVLTNENGDTYTSKSEELMDFLHPVKILNLDFVMQQRELLLAYEKSLYTKSDWERYARQDIEKVVDHFLANNSA